jgi:hypothetical protein
VLAADSVLVSSLNSVRERLARVDGAARAFSSRAETGECAPDEVEEHVLLLRAELVQITGDAHRAIDSLAKVLG